MSVGETENEGERIDAVQCITAHGAKGLEFKHVFILRAHSPSFPSSYKEPLFEFPAALRTGLATESDSKELNQQEERRLFYVAMTRAADRLSLYAKPGTGEKDKTPPGFLRSLMRSSQDKDAWTSRPARELRIDLAAAAEPVTQLESWLHAPSVMPLGPLRLSASAIERYNRCPLQFKLEHEWRLPAKPAAAMQYGAAMHTALKLYGDAVRAGRAAMLAEMQQVFHAELAKYGLDDVVQRSLLAQQGARHLAAFHQAQARTPQPRVQATEWTFTMNLAGVEVTGRLDRIDQLDDASVAIVDYKTGSPRTQEHADDSLQLSLYALAVEERLRMAPEQLVFYNLETNAAIVSARTPQQLQETKERVTETAANIQQGYFEPR
ncbi:MAG: PD-(D/E)XK nuclease family protein, partial [Candidatus Acidiferrum sp.]